MQKSYVHMCVKMQSLFTWHTGTRALCIFKRGGARREERIRGEVREEGRNEARRGRKET